MFEALLGKKEAKPEMSPRAESLADLIEQREALRAFMGADSVGKADRDTLEALNERIRSLGGN